MDRIRVGLPATLDSSATVSSNVGSRGAPAASLIVSASENFITLLDAIKMAMLSKDTLHPLLVETIQAVNRVTADDFDNKGKIVQWLITLNQMKAAEELSPDAAREFQFDMNLAYDGFKSVLG